MPDVDKEFDGAERFVRHVYFKIQDEELQPILFFELKEDAHLEGVPDDQRKVAAPLPEWDSFEKKRRISRFISDQLRDKVHWFLFVCECWTLPPSMGREWVDEGGEYKSLADHPNRLEAVSMIYTDELGSKMRMYDIVRGEGGKVSEIIRRLEDEKPYDHFEDNLFGGIFG